MEYSKLGSSGLSVSRVCLGTMTWGTQNNQKDADQQIEYALAEGVNFIDTAEMYSIPPTPESYGKTETIIGDWISRNSAKRSEFILASKIAGPAIPHVRNGGPITGEAVIEAVDNSLKRLQTDYIDLYQLHWPNRDNPHFSRHWPGKLTFTSFDRDAELAGMLEILQALDHCLKAGKIRHCGLSDDTPWGISNYLRLSKENNLPKMVSIQNEFNLLHTKDQPYLIEQCVLEDIAFLPWSPLAGGMLSGKYLGDNMPEGSRWTMAQRNGLFRKTENTNRAVAAYKALAEQHNMTAAQLALRWCDQVDGVTSTIIGATSMAQLKEDITAFSIDYGSALDEELMKIMRDYPNPF